MIVRLKQDGGSFAVNTQTIALVSPSKIIGKTGIVLVNGISVEANGSFDEIVDRLNGQWEEDSPLFGQL